MQNKQTVSLIADLWISRGQVVIIWLTVMKTELKWQKESSFKYAEAGIIEYVMELILII